MCPMRSARLVLFARRAKRPPSGLRVTLTPNNRLNDLPTHLFQDLYKEIIIRRPKKGRFL